MRIKTKTLTGFLTKIQMTGTQQLREAIFRFEKEGLKISANTEPQQARVIGWLNKTAFVEYEELGNVGMNDIANAVKVFDRFGEIINIKKEGNLLTVKGDNKTVNIELVNENFLNTDTAEPNLTFTETFDMTSIKLHDILKDVTLNKDSILTIKTAEKSVMFSNTGKYKFTNTIEAQTCKGGVQVSFGEPFIDCTSELDGNLQISVGTDYPCKIMEKTENTIITIIIAPRVDNSDE
jgi:hypothetical protein